MSKYFVHKKSFSSVSVDRKVLRLLVSFAKKFARLPDVKIRFHLVGFWNIHRFSFAEY